MSSQKKEVKDLRVASSTEPKTGGAKPFICVICAEKKGLKLKPGIYFPALCSECGEVHTGAKLSDYKE